MTGYDSKRKMAADKFIAAEERKVGERYGYVPKLHPSEWMNDHNEDNLDMVAQPAQEPVKHWSDCAVHNGLAYPAGECDCGVAPKSEREALKLALEALEDLPGFRADIDNAITAIKEALAQPAQEPVAWVCEGFASDEKHAIDYWQENVDDIPIGTLLYTTSPKREWVGLIDTDIGNEFVRFQIKGGFTEFEYAVRAIEAKLKEKNNGT
jgi:hypothetical protein